MSRLAATVLVAAMFAAAGTAPAVAQATPAAAPEVSPEARQAAARGQALYDRGEYAAALAEFDRALAGGLRDGRILYQAGYCQQVTGKNPETVRLTLMEAIGELDQIMQAKPPAPPPTLTDHYYLTMAYAGVGDRPGARRLATQALAAWRRGDFGPLAGLSGEEVFRLGRLAAEGADRELKLQFFGAAATRLKADQPGQKPLLVRALVELGTEQLQAGKLVEAGDSLKRALELEPKAQGARSTYALTLQKRGEWTAALAEWRRVRTDDPANESRAGYNVQLLTTLAQKDLLLDPTRPLEDLAASTPAALEEKMIDLTNRFRATAARLPEVAARRGYLALDAPPDQRAAIKEYRDLKIRIAWVALEYSARGYPLQEFAFSRGLHTALIAWQGLPKFRAARRSGLMPSNLSPEQRAEFERQQAAPPKAVPPEANLPEADPPKASPPGPR